MEEEKIVSADTLAATNGYIGNPFINVGIYFCEPGGGWVKIVSVKPSPVPGKIIVVLFTLAEHEIDAAYMLGLSLV